MMKKILILFTTVFVLASCSISSVIKLADEDLEGYAGITVEASDYCRDLMEDLSAWTFSDENMTEKALEETAEYLKNLPSVSSYGISTEDSYSYVFFDFDSLENFAASVDSGKGSIIEVNKTGSLTEMRLYIDSETVEIIENILPFSEQNGFVLFSSKYNENMEEDEYLEMLEFVFSEEISSEIKNSSIRLVIMLPSDVISTNGEKIGTDVVSFEIPLINLMLLKEPVDLNVVF